jgi:hypothetical protein
MNRYGYEFEPRLGLDGWLFAVGVEEDEAEQAARRMHAEFDIGTDLVFCGRLPDRFQPEPEYIGSQSNPRGKIYLSRAVHLLVLSSSNDPAEAARFFEVGTHSMDLGPVEMEQICGMISAIHKSIALSPIIINSSAFLARFRTRIDEEAARKVLAIMDEYGNHGTEIYGEADWEYADQGGAAGLLVRDQQLHLWWD